MAKCIVCNTNERAYGDENFCANCKQQAVEAANARSLDVNPAVPVGTVCGRHPSALARWAAEYLVKHGNPDLRYLCDHCYRVEHQDLEDDGWTFTGSPVVCTCLACSRGA